MATLSVVDCLKLVSAGSGALFAGGALYINLVEQPSRESLPVKYLREQWKNSFNLAAVRMPALGTISSVAATAVYFLDGDTDKSLARLWLFPMGSFILGGVWTVVTMLPDIRILLDDKCVERKGETWVREAVANWTRRHGVRTLLDGTSFGCILYLCMFGASKLRA